MDIDEDFMHDLFDTASDTSEYPDSCFNSPSAPISHLGPSQRPFPFLSLPTEVRNHAYAFCLTIPPGEYFHLTPHHPLQGLIAYNNANVGVIPAPEILAVSKRVRQESFLVFMQQNTFLIGASVTCPPLVLFQSIGAPAASCLRHLSVHLNDRVNGLEWLTMINAKCGDIKELDLRISPRSPFLANIAQMLRVRSGSSVAGPVIVVDVSILSVSSVADEERQTIRNELKQEFTSTVLRALRSGRSAAINHFSNILSTAQVIRIKGTLDPVDLEALQGLKTADGWSFEKTNDTTITDCLLRGAAVVRTWKQTNLD